MAKKGVKFKGGKELNKLLGTALKGGVDSIEVGFYDSAKYPDGTPVTTVAAAQEFGVGDGADVDYIPERPFFRLASRSVRPNLTKILKAGIDVKKMTVEPFVAEKLGLEFQGEIQKSIKDLRDPPNAEATINRKGSSNPLIDTGFMRQSVTYKVQR